MTRSTRFRAPFASHLLVALPNGRLEGRLERWVVVLLYVVFFGGWLLRAMTSPAAYPCDPFCGPNVFAVWSDEALHQLAVTTSSLAILIIAVPVVNIIWRHWRAATPAARRAFLPAILAIPVFSVIAVIGSLSRTFQLDIGWVADHAVVPPAAERPAASWTPPRSRPGPDPSGPGLRTCSSSSPRRPPGDLPEAGLARAVRDPTLELAFPAPDGLGFVDPTGQPFDQPDGGESRTVTRVERGGKLLAVLLVHDPAIDREDPGLVEAIGSAAGLALENASLAAEVRVQLEEVRASRARLAQAGDAERRVSSGTFTTAPSSDSSH